MKSLKNLLLLALTVCALPVFTSCGSDEEDDIDDYIGMQGGQNGAGNKDGNTYSLSFSPSYSQVVVNTSASDFIFYYSLTANGTYTEYSYLDGNKKSQKLCYNGIIVKGLEPSRTYYCYIKVGEKTSKVMTFQTKKLDVSDIDVKVVKRSFFGVNSYKDDYGYTHDLSGLGNKLEITITSNLGNSYKYGAFSTLTDDIQVALECMNSQFESDFIWYSSSPKSPYTLLLSNPAKSSNSDENIWIELCLDHIEFLLKLVQQGEATSDDYDELASYVESASGGEVGHGYVKAFIEKDGERIYVGSLFHF